MTRRVTVTVEDGDGVRASMTAYLKAGADAEAMSNEIDLDSDGAAVVSEERIDVALLGSTPGGTVLDVIDIEFTDFPSGEPYTFRLYGQTDIPTAELMRDKLVLDGETPDGRPLSDAATITLVPGKAVTGGDALRQTGGEAGAASVYSFHAKHGAEVKS